VRWGVRFLGAALALLLAGFLAFALTVPTAESGDADVRAGDGIAVPTGGAARIATGLALLARGGSRLLITGINPDVSLGAVLAEAGMPPPACCLDVDRSAADTAGNARAAAAWAARHGIARLHLVTSWYHMPRSRLLFARALPGITIVPHPVFPAGATGMPWWREPANWRLVAVEYGKYLWALAARWDIL